MTRFLLPTILLALSACAELPTGRTYLSEMEHDDSTFYHPDEDFPVVGGDAEVTGMSMDEYRRNRLPRTESERGEDRERVHPRVLGKAGLDEHAAGGVAGWRSVCSS